MSDSSSENSGELVILGNAPPKAANSNLKPEIQNLKSAIWILKSETSNPKSEI